MRPTLTRSFAARTTALALGFLIATGCAAQDEGPIASDGPSTSETTATQGRTDTSSPTAAPPAARPSYDVRHDGTRKPCQFEDCTYVSIRLSDWRPGSDVYCRTGGVGAPDWYATIGVDAGGDSGWVNNGPAGRLFDSAGNRFRDGTDTGEFTCDQH